MKKNIVCLVLIAIIFIASCSKKTVSGKTMESAKTETPKPAEKMITYTADIKTFIQTKCTPCHVPSQGGFKTDFDNYEAAKKNIDGMIIRVLLTKDDPKFMPFKKLHEVTADEIATLKKWNEAGMPQ